MELLESRRKRRQQRRFKDAVKKSRGLTEEDDRNRVGSRQMIHNAEP